MYLQSILSDFASLIIALISLIVSFVALIVARKTLIYTSKDFKPNIDFTATDTHKIEIFHKSVDLFKIDYINFLHISESGFWYNDDSGYVVIPFVEESKRIGYIESDGRAKRILITSQSHGPCAYGLCPYNKEQRDAIIKRIHSKFPVDGDSSATGYAAPSLQSLFYIIEVVYTNRFQERKSIIFNYKHYHGHGFDKTTIKEKELKRLLKRLYTPNFKTVDLLWKYLLKKYHYEY